MDDLNKLGQKTGELAKKGYKSFKDTLLLKDNEFLFKKVTMSEHPQVSKRRGTKWTAKHPTLLRRLPTTSMLRKQAIF